LFAAPTTVITAVCYFFGYVYLSSYYGYFGIDAAAIGFTTTDYVLASVRVLALPVMVLLLGVGMLLWGGGAYARRLARAGRWIGLIRAGGLTATTVGALSMTSGIAGLMNPSLTPSNFSPVAFGLGGASVGS
jgi:hypothetical protein